MAEGGHSRYVKLTKEQAPQEDINPGELNQPIDVPQLAGRKCSECGQTLPESYSPPADEPWTTGIFGCTEDPESFSPQAGPYLHSELVLTLWMSLVLFMCRLGLFCPCVLFGRNVESLREDTQWTTPCICHAIFVEGGIALALATTGLHWFDPGTAFLISEGLLFSWWMCGIYTGLVRQSLQKNYHLKNSPCDPCLVHCCLHWCALCQEHREMRGRLSENVASPMTVVNPPPVQEMKADERNHDPAPSSSKDNGPAPSSAKDNDQTELEIQPL